MIHSQHCVLMWLADNRPDVCEAGLAFELAAMLVRRHDRPAWDTDWNAWLAQAHAAELPGVLLDFGPTVSQGSVSCGQ